ncbi:MAG: M20/M25/M40 family metallo-hydrolase [Proteobacteria bacterium]|nr:M20/M25/M40 family metallo-hydrolase [Pseudomonadota bacterium]
MHFESRPALVFVVFLLALGTSTCSSGEDNNPDGSAEVATEEDDDSDEDDSDDDDDNGGDDSDEDDGADSDDKDDDSDDRDDGDSDDDENSDSDDDNNTDSDNDSDEDSDIEEDAGSSTDSESDTFGDCAIDPQRIFDDVAVLASAEFEGREPGTAGDELASQFAEEAFAAAGLKPAGDMGTYRQHFPTSQPYLGSEPMLTISGVTLKHRVDYRVIGRSGQGEVSGEIVFAGYGLVVPPFDRGQYPYCPVSSAGYDDFAGFGSLEGKVVLILRRGPNKKGDIYDRCPAPVSNCKKDARCHRSLGHKGTYVRRRGANALLITDDNTHRDGRLPDGLYIDKAYYQSDLAAVFVARHRIDALIPELRTKVESIDRTMRPQSGCMRARAKVSVDMRLEQVTTANILGLLPGTDPLLSQEVVVVGAHIDHIGVRSDGAINYGADDNAGGVAIVIELARMFAECNIKPKRTFVFAAFNAEEIGLIGSRYYVANPVFPLSDTIAMYNLDMVGAGDGTGALLFGGDDVANLWLTKLMQNSAAAEGLTHVIQIVPQKLAGDHAPFVEAGIPICWGFARPDPHPGYHTPADDINNIRIESLQAISELFWSALRPLSLGEEDLYQQAYSPPSFNL